MKYGRGPYTGTPQGWMFRRMRRIRPWMWGPLKHLWQVMIKAEPGSPYLISDPWRFVYRWKTRGDRELDRMLNECCCHPGQKRGHEHGE